MSELNLLAVSPYIVLSACAVAVMLVSTFVRSHRAYMALTTAGLAGTLACVLLVTGSADRRATTLLRMDDYALFFAGLLVVITGAVIFLSYGYLQRTERQRADYYVLMLLAALGAAILVASDHFASLFLGLEILSVSLYGLIAYPRGRPEAIEAGIKYLVLAASTAAFLLLGMALAYAVSGTMNLDGLAAFAGTAAGWDGLLYRVGLALVFVGIGFKLALVPFHLWTPDVYQGAPAPVTAFIATISKGAVFVLLLRYIGPIDLKAGGILLPIFTAVAYASMVAGNLLALLQQNVKRLLAYSSIAHLGYLLVALIAGGTLAKTAVAFYVAVYSVTLVAAFGVVTVLSSSDSEPESIEAYRGLGRSRPGLAAIFAVAVLSLAGIPITAGFLGKFFVVQAGAGAALWGLLVTLALTSAMSLYYYLRVVIIMFAKGPAPSPGEGARSGTLSPAGGGTRGAASVGIGWRLAAVTLLVLALITILLGVYPEPLVRLIEQAAAGGG